jgi:acetyltransferase-like isoleucine patch superfamily enzyme
MDLIRPIASRIRAAFYRAKGVKIEGRCWLRAIEIPRNHRAITLGDGVALDRGTVLLVVNDGRITIRRECYVNRFVMFDAAAEIEVGERCMIGPNCYITDHDHDLSAPSSGALVTAPTRIGDRCWLGAHVTVLKGVTIGDGTVVGAGSVVTKPLPANVVAVGNPARVIKFLAEAQPEASNA